MNLLSSHFPSLMSFTFVIDPRLYEFLIGVRYFFILFLPILSFFVFFNQGFFRKRTFSGMFLEFGWTLLPITLLLSILTPSLSFLYIAESNSVPGLVVKISGNQWYWVYNYRDLDIEVGSFLKERKDLEKGQRHLFTCSSPCVVPFGVSLQWLITRNDVLHSWNLPSLGVKTDAIPGFITVVNSLIQYPGFYFGMCRELCGNYHTFIAINVEAVRRSLFSTWASLRV